MKLIELLKTEKIQIFILPTLMYLLGALADGFGHLNWILNITGILLQIGAMVLLIVNFVILFDSGLLAARKAVIINLLIILVGLISLSLCWKLSMNTFLVTTSIIILINFIMLIVAMYRMTRVYMEIIKDEKKEKDIKDPKAKIISIIDYIDYV